MTKFSRYSNQYDRNGRRRSEQELDQMEQEFNQQQQCFNCKDLLIYEGY